LGRGAATDRNAERVNLHKQRDIFERTWIHERQARAKYRTPKMRPMTQLIGADCPCGFTFTTPHGQEDAIAIITLHVNRVHSKDFPKGLTRAEAIADLKNR
jgi:hypothetical protein